MFSDQFDPLVGNTDARGWEASFFPEKRDEKTSSSDEEESEDKTKQKLKKLRERTKKDFQNRNPTSPKITDNHGSSSAIPRPPAPSHSKPSLYKKKSAQEESARPLTSSPTQNSKNSPSASLPTLENAMNPFNSSNNQMGSNINSKNSFGSNPLNSNTDIFALFDPLCSNNNNDNKNPSTSFLNTNISSPANYNYNYDTKAVSNNPSNPFYNSNQVSKANIAGQHDAKSPSYSFSEGEGEKENNRENNNKKIKDKHEVYKSEDESDDTSSSSSDDDSKVKHSEDAKLDKPKSKKSDDSKPYHHKRRATAPTNSVNEAKNEFKKQGIIDPPKPRGGLDNIHSGAQTSTTVTTNRTYNVLPELKRGTAFLKYGKRGFPHFRQFQISPDHSRLQWFSKNKKLQQSSILMKDIDEVSPGQSSKEFKRIGWSTLEPASFCVHYDHHTKSLSLVAKSVDEMKMWVQALGFLRDKARRGDNLENIEKVDVSVDFKDRNRPRTKPHSGRFLRSDDPTIKRSVNPLLQQKLKEELVLLDKKFRDVAALSRDPIISKSQEYHSIQRIVSDIEERICELKEEVEKTRDTKIAENDVWRTKVDMEALREKIQVLIRETRTKQRRWSVNF